MPETQDSIIGINKKADQKNKGIPIETLVEYWNRGLEDKEIAQLVGCSKTNVYNRLRPYKEQFETVPTYESSEDFINAAVRQKFAFALLDDDIKKVSPRDKAVIWGIFSDKANNNKGITNNYFQTVVVQAHDKSAQKPGNIIDCQVTPVDNVDNSLNTNETGI